jgi:biopolymer transport protein ExbB
MAIDAQLPPPDLTALGMFLSADIVVKAVMVVLALASVASWTLLLVKLMEITGAQRSLRRSLAAARDASALDDLAGTISPNAHCEAAMLAAAANELEKSGGLPAYGVRERLALGLHRIEAALGRRAGRGVGVLASIGSCAPFIGLFGTVWGIMNAFVGISRTQTTNLAVVAPGIAEALLATATGLVAAIPAVLIYNALTRVLAGHRGTLGDFSAAIQVLVSRDLDRAATPRPRPALLRNAAE